MTAWTILAGPLVLALLNRGGRSLGPSIPLTLLLPWTLALASVALLAIALHLVDGARRLPRWQGEERERFTRILAGAGSIMPIAELTDDRIHRFVGRVEVVDGGTLAATHGLDDDRRGESFRIRDASGVALFDDDSFELWSADGAPEELRLFDGDWVEVIGRGRWATDSEHGEPSGYRREPRVFLLDGTPAQPLHLRRTEPRLRVALEPGEEEPVSIESTAPRARR